MEDIIATQYQLMQNIENIYTNFKKDGPERKTHSSIRRRLTNLDTYWNEFNSNHQQIIDYQDVDHEYFKLNFYQRTYDYYQQLQHFLHLYCLYTEDPSKYHKPENPLISKIFMVEMPKQTPAGIPKPPATSVFSPLPPRGDVTAPPVLPPAEGTSADREAFHDAPAKLVPPPRTQPSLQPKEMKNSSATSKLDEMLRKQRSNFKAFSRTVTNIDLQNISEKWEFEDILKHIEARWAAIDCLHWEIDSELYEEDKDYERTFNTYEKEYNQIKKVLNQKMWSASFRTHSTPTMEIPTFSGDYHRWISFKDLFFETIHNNRSMSNAQKMQFLKGKIRGEAEKLIHHLNISSENYEICWDILNHRYNNKKLIFSSHINILMSLPSMQQQTAPHIKKIHDTAKECLNAIKSLGVDITTWDPLLVHILSQKLDTETHKEYIQSVKNPRELPSLVEFFEFLENKFTSLEASKRKQDIITQKPIIQHSSFSAKKPTLQNNNYYSLNKYSASNAYQANKPIAKSLHVSSAFRCPHCNGRHGIFNCKEFLEMTPEMKLKTVNSRGICINCLYDHKGNKCFSTKSCSKCTKLHNTLLHDAFIKSTNSGDMKHTDSVNVSQEKTSEILLATALIKVLAADGTHHTMRALIDQGSQISLISENAAQRLRAPRRHCKGVVFGLGAQENNSKGSIHITASAIHSDFTFSTDVIIMNNLINNLPNQTFPKPIWPHIEHIKLADPEFYISKPVDLLLGADIYSLIMMGGIIKGDNETQPIAQQTHLGWLLCGNVKTFQCNVILSNIDDIQRFWSIEDIPNNINNSLEDHHCIHLYREQTTRQSDGRYVVRLPMKPDAIEKLGESKSRAIAQFHQLERKLSRNEKLSYDYKTFINEYIKLGHMQNVNKGNGNQTPSYYLPHHCVIRPDSATTALRVVFNASSPTSSGFSLNDLMFSGPNLQQDLLSLILKWRQYEIAFTADIEKMFRQIKLHPDDQNLHKIIWRDPPICQSKNNSYNQPLQEYNLTTVTYGTKAAPFLAMMTLKQLAKDEGHKYSARAKQALEDEFYMDDLLSGSHSINSATKLKPELIALLKSGGFNLRKWSSNSIDLLEGTDPTSNQTSFDFKHPESTKALGLRWNPQEDVLLFQFKLITPPKQLTKRMLLSEISKIFDPLGWLSPVTTKLKLLFQKVWQHEIQWNSELPENISKEWESIREDLDNINQVKVPRWIKSHESDTIELHGFCDSSIKAYACVIYYKVYHQDQKGIEQASIIIGAAKARLVPIKKNITLPRLELMSCLLLSKLMDTVARTLPNYKIKKFGWTDSTAALGWIQGDSNRWKAFVANRVEQIKAVMPSECWRHVKSQENPADCASRGISVTQLQQHTLWWTGPSWLTSYKSENKMECPVYVTHEEIKQTKVHSTTAVATITQQSIINEIICKYSNFVRATRILAWILRAVSSIERLSRNHFYLTISELVRARNMIIKYYQNLEFTDEINCLKNQEKINNKSKILNLNPFLDKEGLLRVGGRIKHAQIKEDMKHPLIIPHDGHLTNLLIDQAHRNTFHGGARLTLSHLRQKYWVIGGNRAVKKHIRSCVICRRHNPEKQNQLMGDLPVARSNPTRPFFNCGVDFTGYVDVKANKGRGVRTTKGYIAVFVCMVTKAVHLELVSDLSSSAFLAALRRMAARRGAPRHIYCDNGTNFVGASRILQQEYFYLQKILDDEFYSQVTDMEVQFHFNAPSWPSAGGLWEAAVKSLKHHLRRVLGEQKLTYEEYSTLLAQIEACLNTRPLCAITEDPEDIDFLTPSHFLASGPTLSIIETERDERTRWQLTQKIFHDIWKRWQNEYLCQLSARSKWQQPQKNQNIGDIVIIQDANLPPGKWSLGRVVELHPGRDGHVRVVSLKTKKGIIQRPIVKLSTLPLSSHEEQSQENKRPQSVEKTSTNTKPKCSSSIKTMIVTLLTMLLILPVQCAYNIAQLKNNQAVYFDKVSNMHLARDEWKLIVYYDMKPYWEGSNMLTKYINQLEILCNRNKEPLCEAILTQLQHGYNELDHYNHLLLGQQFDDAAASSTKSRARRGLINGVGNIARSLFGVLDDQFAEQYQKDIELVRMNQKHLAMLWKNQTSIIEAEHNLLQRVEFTMNKQHKIINQHLNKLEKITNSMKEKIQDITNSNDFALSAIIVNSVLLNLKNIQEYLLDAIANLHHGSFNIHLITPEQLRYELNIISGQLSKDLSLPINNVIEDMPKLYHILKVKAKVTRDYVIFELRLPLVTRDYYEIYQLIPIPHGNRSSIISIKPISEFIALNIQKDSYLPMTQSDIQKCSQYDDETYLCLLPKPLYQMTSDKSLCVRSDVTKQCVTDIRACKSKWLELHDVNTYLFSCCGQCTIRVICESQVSSELLNDNGIITIEENCIIKNEEITIYSHKRRQNSFHTEADVLKINIPSINKIIDLTIPVNNDTSVSNQEDDISHTRFQMKSDEIEGQIQQMKNADTEIRQTDASTHDIMQYVLINLILGIILVSGIALAWRRVRRRCRTHTVSSTGSAAGAEAARAPSPAPAPLKPPRAAGRARPPPRPLSGSSDNDIEMADLRSARIANKATSPRFLNHFT